MQEGLENLPLSSNRAWMDPATLLQTTGATTAQYPFLFLPVFRSKPWSEEQRDVHIVVSSAQCKEMVCFKAIRR